MRLQLQKELNTCPVNRLYNIIPQNIKEKADSLLQEILWKMNHPPKKQPRQTVGNYEETLNN